MSDVPLVRIRYKPNPALHMMVAEVWWERRQDSWPDWELA